MPNVITDNAALFIGFARALFIFLTVWGVNITQPQQDASIALLAAVLPLASLAFTWWTVKTTVPKTPSVDAASSSIQHPVPPQQPTPPTP